MKVKLIKSPKSTKKFRVIFEDGSKVDFGARGYTDYTKHRNPLRMRSYVDRHGGVVPKKILKETSPSKVHRMMLGVSRSTKENWSDPKTAGFWSRWLLWSDPTLNGARKVIEQKFQIKVSFFKKNLPRYRGP